VVQETDFGGQSAAKDFEGQNPPGPKIFFAPANF